MSGTKKYNVNIDVRGTIQASDVPNSTGTFVTWNAGSRIFGTRTNTEARTDLGVYSTAQVDNFLANKVNNVENAPNIGFTNGNVNEPPYFVHSSNVPVFLATRNWVNNDFAQVGGGNLINIPNWQNVLGITTALNLNLQQVTNNGASTTHTISVGGVTTASHGTSADWKNVFDNALMNRGIGFVSNIDANTIPIKTEIYAIETANGSGNTNFPNNGTYGTLIRNNSNTFTTDFFNTNDGDMWFRTFFASNQGANPWRKIWHDGNLPNPATETWVNNNFASQSQLGNYLPLSGGNMSGNINFTANNIGIYFNGWKALEGYINNTVLSANGAAMYFRPNGSNSSTGQVYIDIDGTVSISNATASNHAVAFGQLANYFKHEYTGGIYNGSNPRTNQSWFDYNYASTSNAGVVASFDGLNPDYRLEIFGNYISGETFYVRTRNGDTGQWNPVRELWHNGNLQNPATESWVLNQISGTTSPYKTNGGNIITDSDNGWQTFAGGRYIQLLGKDITVKGDRLNYIGFSSVGSGLIQGVLGSYNTNYSNISSILGNYNASRGNYTTLLGNYLTTTQEMQTVYGNFNKIEDSETDYDKRKIHVFASGKSEYERDNAVEIFADNSTKLRGRGYYDKETRNEEWFSQENTLVDVRHTGMNHLPYYAEDYTLDEKGFLGIVVRHNSGSSFTLNTFRNLNNFQNAANVYGICQGSSITEIQKNTIYKQGTIRFNATETSYLYNQIGINNRPYLVAMYRKSGSFSSVSYLSMIEIIAYKDKGAEILVLLGSFSMDTNGAYFEFNQQILL